MRTVGVDLAAEPKKTAVAVIDWSAADAVVEQLHLGQTDAQVIDAVADADKAGIDCPLGWPEPFLEFLIAHREGKPVPPNDIAARRSLAYRTTDLVLIADTGARPLSVAADLIAHTAMRAAGILSSLADRGRPVDRAGSGVVVEAYPAAALRRWRLHRPGYKGAVGSVSRAELLADLMTALPALHISPDDADRCRRSDDVLDAVVCALIARAASIGKVTTPNVDQAKAAATEGWIVVPTCELAELFG